MLTPGGIPGPGGSPSATKNNAANRGIGRFFSVGVDPIVPTQAKCAKALFASAMRWVSSRFVIALPSFLAAP
jgi:hypothetical protein